MKCIKLKCEYQTNPIGIDVKNPRFSWQIESEKQNIIQETYRIQCSNNKTFEEKKLLWDTGFVSTNNSNQIEYKGRELSSFQGVYWRVMVETNRGVSAFSEIAYFEMGFLDTEWLGNWITSDVKFQAKDQCPILKKNIYLTDTPVSARMYITSLGVYESEINSNKVNQDILAPGWTSYNNHLQYQTYDVKDMLVKGENTIAVTLGSGWYMGKIGFEKHGGPENRYGDTVALLAQIEAKYADGQSQIIVTDDSWKSDQSAIIFSGIYDGEHYDARIESSKNYDELASVKIYEPENQFDIVGQITPGVRVIDTIKPVELITTPNGDKVLDFGQNMVGWVKVSAQGNAGDEIYLKHGEIMLDNEFYNVNMRSAKTEALYILKGEGIETFEPHFTFFGFRYVKIEKYPGDIDINQFKGIVISSDIEYSGMFKCSNEKVNKLYENIVWGQKGNFVDIPTDCPQRDERLGWTADTQVFAATACYNAMSVSFYDKWLKDLAFDQLPNGCVPFVVPDVVRDSRTSSAWGDAATIVPYTLYRFYKDKKILERQYHSMKKWVEYIRAEGETETLWNTGFQFNDWLAKDGYGLTTMHGATPKDLVATAMFYYSTTLLVKSAQVLGYTEDVAKYNNLAERIKQTFNYEFVTKAGRISGETQTAYTLAIQFNLLDDKNIEVATKQLVELVRREEHRITTGFVGTPYIAHVLSNNGYNEDAYRMLLNEECPGWLYQVNMGATTIWERWDSLLPDGSINSGRMNSFNHYAYGSIAQWLFEVVLGITPDNGFQTFNIAPKPNPLLGFARGAIDTLYGRIQSAWEINEETITVSVSIPCNTTAKLYLPEVCQQDFKDTIQFENVDGALVIMLGSGNYSFTYSNKDIKALK
ncbi:alpha-L-rhamnosidase [Clostridium grantii]|uniref:alpha-L-rhamnosidase n=1 Tax=Clostridium grantii DSM 8605 TaxID=1121316 RepID=A0A1M5XS02_9CLOT|nr:alpha-L-rhamnosidase [Clostridium grantii]SHI02560.1 alpha-L-rhamnosidase [Clostridium grantii DSM 8605]